MLVNKKLSTAPLMIQFSASQRPLQGFFGTFVPGACSGLFGAFAMGPAAFVRLFLHRQILEQRELDFKAVALYPLTNEALETVVSSWLGYGPELERLAYALDITAAALRLNDQLAALSLYVEKIYHVVMHHACFEEAAAACLGHKSEPKSLTKGDLYTLANRLFCAFIALGDLYYSAAHETESTSFFLHNIDYICSRIDPQQKSIQAFLEAIGLSKKEISCIPAQLATLLKLRTAQLNATKWF